MATPIADVDDTAGFMAAARALKLNNSYGKPPPAADDASVDHDASQTPVEEAVNTAPITENGFDDPIDFPAEKNPSAAGDSSVKKPDTVDSGAAPLDSFGVNTPETEKTQPEEENRENLSVFKTWGTPAIRAKPAAQVRRVIIKGLPSSWSTPDKVLSLVHGGMIESISITASGNAHILFCDPEACKSFYDKYPNGIDLDKERKLTVFVDMGEDVDVISSQLSFNLSVGSTRVVRAVGVDLEATMSDLVKIATSNSRKVEKIIDSYVSGYPRSVSFRFCSIDDAVRFRSALIRNEDWEHCNVQYATDPCEVATGYHAD
ncbi:uncharacterized protein BJX67DRAFT_381929 [Aspergillus lucknowensis]|uniref:RRM domain-containing protein n=1 Tax=Aspergillus lucknowensis TaxID=176173 RepID=A0ABR4LPL6_9EURO